MTTETKELTTPSVYVGTYKKYNEGSLFGAWVELTKFDTKEDFIHFCFKLHKDEDDPELMYQDYEGFPASLYNEGYMSDDIWEWLELDEDEHDKIEAFIECFGGDLKQAIEKCTDAFCGEIDTTFEAWCLDTLFEDHDIPDELASYISASYVAADYKHTYTECNGYVFFRDW
tara:strand:- start:349 stop:864 length:516 start_codon:yes stop_codon:yes gene_type:complete